MAIIDAGIEIYDVLAACEAAVVGGVLRVDPSAAETAAASAIVRVASLPSLRQTTAVVTRGAIPSLKTVLFLQFLILTLEALDVAIEGCATMSAAVRKELTDGYLRRERAAGGGGSWEGRV
jgi:ribonuclease PH